jgi:hypothetical protein
MPSQTGTAAAELLAPQVGTPIARPPSRQAPNSPMLHFGSGTVATPLREGSGGSVGQVKAPVRSYCAFGWPLATMLSSILDGGTVHDLCFQVYLTGTQCTISVDGGSCLTKTAFGPGIVTGVPLVPGGHANVIVL